MSSADAKSVSSRAAATQAGESGAWTSEYRRNSRCADGGSAR